MVGSAQPDQLVAAVLSDEVYHSEQTLADGTIANVIINPPAGWELIPSIEPSYDPTTGYYGEAWGELTSAPGVYSKIIVVNRGTTFSKPGSDAFLTDANVFPDTTGTLHDAWPPFNNIDPTGDLWQTIGADATIVASTFTGIIGSVFTDNTAPAIVAAGDAFYQAVRFAFPTIPIVETGQSLGGAISDAVVAQNLDTDPTLLTADTFNALPYSYSFTGISDASEQAKINAAVTNYYVGNEIFTQRTPADWWIFSSPVGGTTSIAGAQQSSGRVILPDLATQAPSAFYPITIHNPDAAVAAMFESLYDNSSATSSSISAVSTLLSNEYNDPNTIPATIKYILNIAPGWVTGGPGATPTVDNSEDTVTPNYDKSVTAGYNWNGTPGSATAFVTVPTYGLTNVGSISVHPLSTSVTPINPPNGVTEVAATETDVMDTSNNLIAIEQTMVFSDGSQIVEALDPTTRAVKETYTGAQGVPAQEQTYNSNGNLQDTIIITPENTIQIEQYDAPTPQSQGQAQNYSASSILSSNSTIDLVGTGVVSYVVELADQSVLTELDYSAGTTSEDTYIGIVANPDGSADVVEGAGEDGTAGQLINFGTAGLADDQVSIDVTTGGSVDITTDIDAGTATIVNSDESLSGVQEDFVFSGSSAILQIGTVGDFTGMTSNFVSGNTIDLAGIGTATIATLGAGNQLTITGGSTSVTLNLDPNQDYTNQGFLVSSDGNGGTDVTVQPEIHAPNNQPIVVSSAQGACGAGIVFDGRAGTVTISNVQNFIDTVFGFQLGDTIDLPNLLSPYATLLVNQQSESLIIENYPSPYFNQSFAIKLGSFNDYYDYYGNSTPENYDFNLVDAPGGKYYITTIESLPSGPCYCAGTLIRSEQGEIAVESLGIGDLVVTASGQAKPVKWLGHRTVDCRRHLRPHDVWPVRIHAGAFGQGMPARDLFLSPDHAVFMDGVLIPIRYLINDATIIQEPRDEVTYWHVELDRHDVILAEGLPCESYLDTGNRGAFANGGASVQLHPDFALRIWETQACAPLIYGGAELEAARSHLLERAAILGHVTTRDSLVRILAGGREVLPDINGGGYRFTLPPQADHIRLVSRYAVPAHMHDDSDDHRPLGVAVSRIRLDGQEIALTDPRLGAGWHAHEGEGSGWRWTAGDAAIVGAGARVLEIEVAMTACYWLEQEATGVQSMAA